MSEEGAGSILDPWSQKWDLPEIQVDKAKVQSFGWPSTEPRADIEMPTAVRGGIQWGEKS